MAYADISDVEIDFGTIDDADVDKVDVLLDRAEARVRQAFPDIDTMISDGRTSLVLVVQVESEMVCSVLRNPNCYQSESQTVGGLSSSYTVNLAAASGLLRLTDDQKVLLSGDSGTGGSGGGFTIRPSHGRPGYLPRVRPCDYGWVPE